MLKLLSRLLGRDLTTPPSPALEPDPKLSDARILREYFSVPKETRQSLKTLLGYMLEHLDEKERKRLTRIVMGELNSGSSVAEALIDGLLGDKGQKPGKWALIQADWKGVEVIERQGNELAAASGIPDRWVWDWRVEPNSNMPRRSDAKVTVPRGLMEFSRWVSDHGKSLVHLDLGGDAYYAFVTSSENVAAAVGLSEELKIKIQSSDLFSDEYPEI